MALLSFFSKLTNHALFKSSLIYTITDVINKAIPFFLLPFLTHYLLPSEYGITTNFNIFVSILTIFIGLSIQGAIAANFYKLNKTELSIYVSNALLIIFFSFIFFNIVVFLLKDIIYSFLPISFLYIFGGTCVAFVQAISSINLTLWQLNIQPYKFGIYGITQTALNVSLSLILIIVFNMGWEGRINAAIIAAITYGIFSLYLILKRTNFVLDVNRTYLKDALSYCLPLLPHGLSIWVRSGVDRIYLTHFFGESETGLYATGFQFALLISFVTLSFNNAYVPYLYKNLSLEDQTQLIIFKKKIVRFTYLYLFGLVLFCLLMIGVSLFIIQYFLSKNYIDAQKYIPGIMVSQVFQGMYLMVVNYIFYTKKTKELAIITFSCSIFQVIASYFFIKYLGGMGAVYSTILVSFIICISVWWYSNKVYPMPWFKLK